jgi:hypothetical protein
MIMMARSKTERTSSSRAALNLVRMHFWTADGSGLFLPHRFGKAVMIVSIKFVISVFNTRPKNIFEVTNGVHMSNASSWVLK